METPIRYDEIPFGRQSVTYEYDVKHLEKVWLTISKEFYEMILKQPNATPMFSPDLAWDESNYSGLFGSCYLVGILRDTKDYPDGQASPGEQT